MISVSTEFLLSIGRCRIAVVAEKNQSYGVIVLTHTLVQKKIFTLMS